MPMPSPVWDAVRVGIAVAGLSLLAAEVRLRFSGAKRAQLASLPSHLRLSTRLGEWRLWVGLTMLACAPIILVLVLATAPVPLIVSIAYGSVALGIAYGLLSVAIGFVMGFHADT